MTSVRIALKIVLLWCWLFASINCGKGEKKPEPSIDLSTVVECVGESWHEDLKSIRPYAPSSVDEYLHAKKGYKAYQTFRHIALRHLISTGPGLLNTLLHYAAKESTKLLLCERDGLGRMCGKVLLKHDENDDSNQELAVFTKSTHAFYYLYKCSRDAQPLSRADAVNSAMSTQPVHCHSHS